MYPRFLSLLLPVAKYDKGNIDDISSDEDDALDEGDLAVENHVQDEYDAASEEDHVA